MKLKQEQKRQIEEIVTGYRGPKNCRCYRSGFENLCRAADIGLKSFLLCLEKNPWECKFSLSRGHQYFCTCPLRNYTMRELKKE
ncbi:MAG TPA: hypothetical protein VMW81_08780 [Nitrospinota bacterium]|nr:hypothetical protein [Nitrospinota bacterium]